ncbi:MAG: hypothetical protein ACFFDW_08980 [Candidatus Thorarchaeota archaeon]
MVNIKLLIDAIAMPIGLITTIVIISKNKRNLTNILIGMTAFMGGVLSVLFSLLKEIFYSMDNYSVALLFVKLSFISLFSMSIFVISFTIFFWKAKYTRIPSFSHIFAIIPTIIVVIWLFLDQNSIIFFETPYGINNILNKGLLVFSLVIVIITLVIFSITVGYMSNKAKNFPQLKKLMNIFMIIFVLGFGSTFLSQYLFQYFFHEIFQPFALIMILTLVSLIIVFSITLSQEEKLLWHGCPKLLLINGTETLCANTEDGVPIEIKLLDLGNIIERIQIDTEVLKTGYENCTNTVFMHEDGLVRCLTTHEPIKVLDEFVTREEMELARNMSMMSGNEYCSECLHKIIAYRKENKDKSDSEIKQIFLGVRAEEFFGLA